MTFSGYTRKFGVLVAIFSGLSLLGLTACVLGMVFGQPGVICASGLMTLMGLRLLTKVGWPPHLTVDAGGLTLQAGQRATRLLWEQIEQVRIIELQFPPGTRPSEAMRAKVAARKGWLVVWLVPGVPMPAGKRPLPQWVPQLAGVRFCELYLLTATEAEVAEALRRYAGERFDPTRAPR